MAEKEQFVRFDWAMKRLLRDKANYVVLEGLITVLLNEPTHIVELLKSEDNQNADEDKFNSIDIKAKNDRNEIFIVEVRLLWEKHHLVLILYGTAKAITKCIHLSSSCGEVKKIYSINIAYFDFIKGDKYLYRGCNKYAEYLIINVNEFSKVAWTPLEEWLDYLKNGHIEDNTKTPGLQEAREKLQYQVLDNTVRCDYDEYVNAMMMQNYASGNTLCGRCGQRTCGRY